MDEVTPSDEKEKVLLTWTAKSQPFKPEDMKMQPVLIVMAVLVTIVLIFAQEWMLLLLMAAGGFYWYATKKTEPLDVEFSLTNKGIRAFNRMYMWWEMKSWWWEEKWTTKMLVVDVATGMMGRLYIPIEKVKPVDVEKIMSKYLVLLKPADTPVDKMAKWVKEKFPLENKT
jgi:hypothetical protein